MKFSTDDIKYGIGMFEVSLVAIPAGSSKICKVKSPWKLARHDLRIEGYKNKQKKNVLR
jgi:hypothetical protein